jgi:2-dehydro-3-deoxyglucarate aldolase/4-hydroxy-2-oxoheptanedioate aldolase
MVPMVETAKETEAIVAAAKYPPHGRRGFAVLYVDEHGGDVEGYMRKANDETIVIVMIETSTALKNLEAIASVEGVDVLWVGHYDLTASLGIPGCFEDDRYLDALDRVVAACVRHGIAAGISTDSVEDAETLIKRGFRFLAYGHDLVLLRTALASGLDHLRASAARYSPAQPPDAGLAHHLEETDA